MLCSHTVVEVRLRTDWWVQEDVASVCTALMCQVLCMQMW